MKHVCVLRYQGPGEKVKIPAQVGNWIGTIQRDGAYGITIFGRTDNGPWRTISGNSHESRQKIPIPVVINEVYAYVVSREKGAPEALVTVHTR